MGTVSIQSTIGACATDVYAGSVAPRMLVTANSCFYADASSVPWTPISSSVHPLPFSVPALELRDAYAPESRCSEMLIPGPSGPSVFFRTSPLNRGEQLSHIEDAVFKRAEGFRLLHRALLIETGESLQNAELKQEIGKAMAGAGFYEEALAIHTWDPSMEARLKLERGKAMARSGMRDRAIAVWKEALAIDTGRAGENAKLKLNVGKAMAGAGMRDRALKVWKEALAVDTGGAWENANLKIEIGKAMAGAGFYEEALAIDTGDEWKGLLKCCVGRAMAEAGFYEEALAIDTGRAGENAELKLNVGKAMAGAGFYEEALAIDMGHGQLDAELKLSIGKAMVEAGLYEEALAIHTWDPSMEATLKLKMGEVMARYGMRDRAIAVLKEALAIDNVYVYLKLKIGEAIAEAGFYKEALAIDTGDALDNAMIKLSVGKAMADQASCFLAENRAGAQDYLEVAATASVRQLVHMGAAMSMDEIRLVAAALSDGRRDFRRAQDLMTAGHLSVWHLRDGAVEERAVLVKRHAGLVQHAVKKKRPLASVYPSLLILYHLQAAGENAAVSVLLDAGRALLAKNRTDYPLLQILVRCDSSKAKDLAMRGVSSGLIGERQSWLLLERLIDDGYLGEGLSAFLDKRISSAGEDGKVRLKERSFLLRTIQYVHRELGLCPDVQLMEFILDGAGDIDAVYAKVAELREYKTTFDAIEGRRELIAKLAQNKKTAAIYFILYGGRTRYALVNNYDLSKFLIIVKKMHVQRIHEKPLKEFLKLFPDERREVLRDRLLAGRFPLDGEPGHAIRIDVSGSARLSAVEGRAAQVFGLGELGAVIKTVMYRMSDELTDEEKAALENMGGIGDAPAIIAAIEKYHPGLAEETANGLRESWKKLMGKRVLDVGVDQVFGNETNEVSLGRMVKGLEEARRALANGVRQEFKTARKAEDVSTEAARVTRDQRLAALEEKARAKLLRYILQDMMIGEGDEQANRLFDEWESHLDQVLTDFEGLKEGSGGGRKEKQVFVRFLDKRADLVEFARMADSAQCCFNSKNYIIQNNMGAADWIAMLSSDPLSFAFQIEQYPATNAANAIGFVFGSFGVRDGKPAVLLNGVYMEGKTDAAAQMILNEIEQRFSRPIGAASQIVASKHAGSSKMDSSYSNEPVEVKRLRALVAPNSGKPITVIYDDLNVGVNEPQKTDGEVWHKDF